VKVVGLAPLVPIMPDLKNEVHRQWQSYNAYTWAFKDYLAAGIVEDMDGEEMEMVYNMVDPMSYMDRLEKIPKLIMISSDDEFMQFDWTNIWYDKMRGETHIDIVANSEHSMITGIIPSLSNISTFFRSIASGKTSRPTFEYKYDD
jgi:PhoPQ-activated pathogenicity-related protein